MESASRRCPVCGLVQPLKPNCRRCKADWTLVLRVVRSQERLIRLATTAIEQQDWESATARLDEAARLGHHEQIGRLHAMIALARQDFGSAWRYFRQGTPASASS
ncbi:hypothetical protein [Tuwongella immobilis]|uniref:Exonuclease n=1 Tax=Tuwongella immobilis TaxID=692036 RepID=A0A6C2YMX8_9BACT|nr:hypothetical protein [Tuwongella immobilis]VIP02958.1 Exonuclease OS=Isosphaera pallida (strain ATCC 43644 / DSM 9630 / IS1B) GN=Isop_3140 PE=4 SV=1 [Tuwongella immobilis]VTS02962.1 Exonuclease OS=Isosphaera pallida (strain ATCC 43644 / DSM 9630 / IS1B) GN=Isop_3140 PE=4 SV=1 [Tuwongella immobilis]